MKSRSISSMLILAVLGFAACSPYARISKTASRDVLNAPTLKDAHVGISIADATTGKSVYEFQSDKYFIPASNTKIVTCYAAMKYLGDSLVGLRYAAPVGEKWKQYLVIRASGDPTLLLAEFPRQPVFDFLQKEVMVGKKTPVYLHPNTSIERWGNGWSWNDFEESYMAERSALPIHGNVVNVELLPSDQRQTDSSLGPMRLYKSDPPYFDTLLNRNLPAGLAAGDTTVGIDLSREVASNTFFTKASTSKFRRRSIPFVTENDYAAIKILSGYLKTPFEYLVAGEKEGRYEWFCYNCDPIQVGLTEWRKMYSQPTDSLLKPMMHRSDNFFAEQSLLMVSEEHLGVMNDEAIIDTILKTALKDLPQKPRWVDGSGLSRYNLFTPEDFVSILSKMKNEFGMDRIKNIFPTAGRGTLSAYYLNAKDRIFAKTGSLSGVVSLSGFLYTRSNRLLIFSILVNNHNGSATDVRRSVEKFLLGVIDKL